MNTAKLVFAFVRRNPLVWAFNMLTLALGVGVVVAVMLLGQALDRRFAADLGGVDLVVGAKGSPLQLIMSSLFQVDVPTGNIPLAAAEKLAAHPLVAASAMLSLGDNVKGLRIVGTTPAYLDLYGAKLARGALWSAPFEVVLGATAARTLGLDIGGTFAGQHGLTGGGEIHDAFPYRVVGVLEPSGTVADRLVLTGPESVWEIHEHEEQEVAAERGETAAAHPREVTALLIRYKSASGAILLPRLVDAMPDMQAAIPAVEASRLRSLLGAGADVVRWLGLALLGLSALGFVVTLFAAVQQRRRELALLRVLGARPVLLFGAVLLEALLLGLAGGVAGVGIGHAMALVGGGAAASGGGPDLVIAPPGLLDLAALGAAACLALAASFAPAFAAYRLDPAQTLKSG